MYDLEFQGQTLKIRNLFQHYRHPKRPQNCWNRYTDNVCVMLTTGDTKGHTQMCLTFIFKVKHQGQVTDFRSTVRVTWFFLTYLISSTSKMLESTPRSTSYHVYNRRWERSCKKVFDLDSQGHAMKIEFFHYHYWIPWPENIPMRNIFKIRTGRQKSRGLYQPPLGLFRLAKYLGHLRVNL